MWSFKENNRSLKCEANMDFREIIIDALIDSVKMLPFLYAAFLLMEYIEHKAGDKLAIDRKSVV